MLVHQRVSGVHITSTRIKDGDQPLSLKYNGIYDVAWIGDTATILSNYLMSEKNDRLLDDLPTHGMYSLIPQETAVPNPWYYWYQHDRMFRTRDLVGKVIYYLFVWCRSSVQSQSLYSTPCWYSRSPWKPYSEPAKCAKQFHIRRDESWHVIYVILHAPRSSTVRLLESGKLT